MENNFYCVLDKQEYKKAQIGLNIGNFICGTKEKLLTRFIQYYDYIADIIIPENTVPQNGLYKEIIIMSITKKEAHPVYKECVKQRKIMSKSKYRKMMKYRHFKCQRTDDNNVFICNRRAHKCDSCGLRLCDKCREEIYKGENDLATCSSCGRRYCFHPYNYKPLCYFEVNECKTCHPRKITFCDY